MKRSISPRGTLRDRDASESTASLAAQMGMAAFSHASAVWFRHPERDLDRSPRRSATADPPPA
jgi:hypothetical protein